MVANSSPLFAELVTFEAYLAICDTLSELLMIVLVISSRAAAVSSSDAAASFEELVKLSTFALNVFALLCSVKPFLLLLIKSLVIVSPKVLIPSMRPSITPSIPFLSTKGL